MLIRSNKALRLAPERSRATNRHSRPIDKPARKESNCTPSKCSQHDNSGVERIKKAPYYKEPDEIKH